MSYLSRITHSLIAYRRALLHWREMALLWLGLTHLSTPASDKVLREAGKICGAAPLQTEKKKYVFVTGYYFRNLHMIWDGILALGLRARGHSVLGVSAGAFFRDECLYFGGNYQGIGRHKEIRRVRALEYLWWRRILRLPHVFIGDFEEPEDNDIATTLVENLPTIEELKNLKFRSVDVGFQASLVTLNMFDQTEFEGRQDEYDAIVIHCKNIVRYILVFERFLGSTEISAVVSNWPYYYKWSVPYALGRSRNLDFFCYMIADKKDSFYFAKNPSLHSTWDLADVEAVWDQLHSAITDFSQLKRDALALFDSKSRSYRNAYVLRQVTKSRVNLNLESDRTTVLVPLNVLADAAVLLGTPEGLTYSEFLEYLGHLALECPEIDFVLKAHPDEKVMEQFSPGKRPSVETVLKGLRVLEKQNIYFLSSESSIRVSELLDEIDYVLCFTSSVIFEASIRGVPCIQVGFSGYYDLPFTLKPQSLREVPRILRGRSDMPLALDFPELALKSFLLGYVYGQVDLGLASGTDFGPSAEIVVGTTARDILDNPVLGSLCQRVLERRPWFSKSEPPPPTGHLRITTTGLQEVTN